MTFDESTSALDAIANHKKRKERVVFTNGCFDILHIGHLRYLEQAKELGDVLVVGVNSDSSVKKLKGDKRPLVPEAERREMLLGLKPVDYVVIFSEETPLCLIETIAPDVLVKGGDWSVDKIVGADIVKKNGGEVKSLPFVEGHSSTALINKMVG